MPSPRTRQRVVNAAMGAFRTKHLWHYAEVRPIPYNEFNRILNGSQDNINTDCSGLVYCCYERAGVPTLKYDGQGFTGTLLNSLPPTTLRRARKGDVAVLGVFPGKHAVLLLEGGTDPLCVSHGKPGDPSIGHLSNYLGLGPLNVLNGVPRMSPIRRKKRSAKWRVVGDHDKLIGHVRTTRWLWQLRHRKVCKAQREQLAFHRIHPATLADTNKGVA